MKRLSVELDPELHKRLKVAAAEQGISVAELVKKALQPTLTRPPFSMNSTPLVTR